MSLFESIKHVDESGNEYWTSRAMWKILAYTEYRHFLPVIDKAKIACRNSGQRIEDHFEDILEMVGVGSGAKRPVESVKLSRYACYLIVQNSDPNKTIVAQGQTYFAIQTRIAEVQQMAAYQALSSEEEKRLFLRAEMLKHNSLLASVAKDAGVIDAKDYAVFQNWGYQGLYGGMTAKDIHYRKGLKKTQKILDHMKTNRGGHARGRRQRVVQRRTIAADRRYPAAGLRLSTRPSGAHPAFGRHPRPADRDGLSATSPARKSCTLTKNSVHLHILPRIGFIVFANNRISSNFELAV